MSPTKPKFFKIQQATEPSKVPTDFSLVKTLHESVASRIHEEGIAPQTNHSSIDIPAARSQDLADKIRSFKLDSGNHGYR